MSIVASELKGYLSASMPEDDVSASGGAIDLTGKFELANPSSADRVSAVSDGADSRTVTITGRDASGAIISDAIVLNGTTVVDGNSGKVFERILKITTSSNASRTVTISKYAAAAHTPTLATMEPLIVTIRSLFYAAASQAGATVRYEKIFQKNTNGTLTLTSAAVKLTGDPAGKIKIAAAAAVSTVGTPETGSTPAGARLGASNKPATITFVDDNVSQSVPGGALATAESIGVWVEQSLGAGDAAFKNTYTVELSGTTT